MKFQNISIHDSKLMLCTIKQHQIAKKIAKGHNSKKISFNWLKTKSGDLLLSPISVPNIKALAQIIF